MLSRFSILLIITFALGLHASNAQTPSPPPESPAPTTQPNPPIHTPEEIKAHGTFPRLRHSVDPAFTTEARQKNIHGYVQVSLVVDEQGRPTRLKVIRGLGYGLDEEALRAVSQYRFKPGTYKHQPISVPLFIDVNFELL